MKRSYENKKDIIVREEMQQTHGHEEPTLSHSFIKQLGLFISKEAKPMMQTALIAGTSALATKEMLHKHNELVNGLGEDRSSVDKIMTSRTQMKAHLLAELIEKVTRDIESEKGRSQELEGIINSLDEEVNKLSEEANTLRGKLSSSVLDLD